MAVFEILPEDYFQSKCRDVKARQLKVLELMSAQAKTIEDSLTTQWRIDEKTTKLVQEDVKHICIVFNDLVSNNITATVLRTAKHPAMAEIDEKLKQIAERCGVCRLPLAEGLTEDEYMSKRVDCLMAEEDITNLAHRNLHLESILIDREMEGHHWTVATRFPSLTPIHDFYETLLRKDSAAARKLISHNQAVLEGVVC
jgi:hypothetical protein